jgi:hypothetical protein
MTPISHPKISQSLNFGKIKGKEIIANFDAERILSDAEIILMAELDKKLKITERFADCFQDYRNLSSIDYLVHQLVSQRIYGLILGYDDVNDHDKLHYDPALEIALLKLNLINSDQGLLVGKSTINRIEFCLETIINQEESRYHRIEPDPKKIEKLFVDIFLQSYKKPPRQIILDMDVTDD